MTLQTGHLAYSVKQNDDQVITDQQGEYMMWTISNPFESLANVFKSIWALFLAIAFWNSGQTLIMSAMILFSLLFFYYLFITLDVSLVKRVKLFSKAKPNPLFVNLETLLFFFILVSYLSVNDFCKEAGYFTPNNRVNIKIFTNNLNAYIDFD